MTKLKRCFPVILISIVLLALTACSANAIDLLGLFVSSAEILLPSIPNLPPADAAKVSEYLDPALLIANNLLADNATQSTVSQAVNDFNRLIVPQLSADAPASTRELISNLGKIGANIVRMYRAPSISSNFNTAVSAFAEPDKKKAPPKPLSEKDKKKAAALKKRVEAARAKLAETKKK